MNQMTLGRPNTPSTLNAGQQAAADGFFEFLFSKEKEMGISGPGGVGKTHLMGHMIDTILPQYFESCRLMGVEPEYTEVMMTATTNKAAEQLSKATGRPCSTIQSAMNLKVSDDHESGTSKLTKKSTWEVHKNKIIFIDECSMEDTPLYGHIQAGTQNCKIVHVGDHCQLAPVRETLSPVYKQNMRFYNLTEPMRTKVPELQALNEQLRHTVETGEFLPIQIVPGIIDHLNDEQMEAEIAAHFHEQTNASKILAYTNDRVLMYNDHIRTLRQLPDELTVGELMIVNSAIHVKQAMLNTEQEVEIAWLSDKTELINLGSAQNTPIELEVRRATLTTPIGGSFPNVPVPVDMVHYKDLVRYFANQKNWERYFHLKNFYPDLRPHDASTVYKAQGSTYDTVFIDLGNISTCKNPNQAARMLYVACSRPRHRIVLYGQLAERFGGLRF